MTHWRVDLIRQGLKLRAAGLSYSAIAIVFNEYHDFPVTGGAVRRQLRTHGALPDTRRPPCGFHRLHDEKVTA